MWQMVGRALEWIGRKWATAPLSPGEKLVVAGGSAVGLFFCSFFTFAIALAVLFPQPQAQVVYSYLPTFTTAPKPTATEVFIPTDAPPPTRNPSLLSGATLGGPEDAFDRAYGYPTDGARPVTVGGVRANMSVLLTQGADGILRAEAVELDAPVFSGTSWSRSAGQSFIQRFVPSGSTVTGYDKVHDGSTAYLMHSSRLATALQTSGNFDWYCERNYSTSGVDHCVAEIALE